MGIKKENSRNMSSSSHNIKDLLTSFSPSSDFFAISSGDGRIKVWDTIKGQVQTQFADIASTAAETTNDGTSLYKESGNGHLSLDYTCMKWFALEKKKKKKVGQSLLVAGTGSGDVIALDVSSGQLKWRSNDCHPGGVNAVSFSTESSSIYSAGVDGMVCQTDPASGNLLGKFKASTKAISSMVISPDGKTLATAAAQLKIFNCSNNKKIQKFSGHPGAVRCMIFSDDGKYVLSSAAGERYVALWEIDGSKKQSASCVLSMDHPAVFLDCKCKESDAGIYVLAVSEVGQCYFWYGKHIEELRNAKPTRISLSAEGHFSMNHKSALPMIFAAVLQVVLKSGSGLVHLVYGSMIKPSFEKILVTYGTDTTLNSTQVGVLLPLDQSHKNTEGNLTRNRPWPSANLNFIRVKDKYPKSSYKALEGHYYEEMVYTVHNSAAGTSASAVKPKKGVSQTGKSKKGKKGSSHTRSSASQAQLVQHQLAYQQNFQQHQQQLQQHLQTFWASQYQEIEHTTDFKNHSLPLARIKKIMNADKDVRRIAGEVPVIFARACEMFILELTLRSWNHTEENKRRTLRKNDIAAAITRTDIFDFLVDIVPREDLKDEGIAMPRAGPVPVADLQ